jgi:hypothetical protein
VTSGHMNCLDIYSILASSTDRELPLKLE